MRRGATLAAAAWAVAAPLAVGSAAGDPSPPGRFSIPLAVRTLDNGLTVVASRDRSSPTFGLSVVYKIGFRLEPRGRTGFAHLFEHMMFQGTPRAPKGVFDRVIEGGGGINNGSTRYDYTNYVVAAPVSALDAVLWLEADRMRSLDFSPANLANQQEVVKEEIRVNVKNRPYGGLFWTDLAAAAFDKWENAHDGYGSFDDLDAATVDDVESFFRAYYGPNNAVVSVVGDVEPAEVFAKVEKYFGAIPVRPAPPTPDVSEPLNLQERRRERQDPLARVPALAAGWKMPEGGGPDHAPAAVLAELLVGGEASRLYRGLVKGREAMLDVHGGINWPLGDAWSYAGPTLMVVFGLYKPGASGAEVVDAMQSEIERIARDGVPAEELARTKTQMLSSFYSGLEPFLDRADALAVAHALHGDAASVNRIPERIEAVTAAEVSRVAATYLTVANRTWIDCRPSSPATEEVRP